MTLDLFTERSTSLDHGSQNRPRLAGQRHCAGPFRPDVYDVMSEVTYLYDAEGHRLVPHKAGNYQAMTGTQDFVDTAPLNLLYVGPLPDGVDSILCTRPLGFKSEHYFAWRSPLVIQSSRRACAFLLAANYYLSRINLTICDLAYHGKIIKCGGE
jgi:hypothetical protein